MEINNITLQRLIDAVQEERLTVVKNVVSEIKDELRLAEYVEGGGLACPVCGNTNIDSERGEFDARGAYQNCCCNECGQTWTDHFALVAASFDDNPST